MSIPLTLLLHLGIMLLGVTALRLMGIRTRPIPLLLGFGVIVLYWIVSPLGLPAQRALPALSELNWNWLGKVFAIALALAGLAITRGLSRGEIGLTLRQRAGSVLPAALVIALVCIFAWAFEAWLHDGTDFSIERLLFQGIMPGLDEELVYRGILLALFTRAFPTGWEFAGAPIGVADIAVTFLFAAGHGLYVTHDGLIIGWHGLIEAGVIGSALVWLRRRTGSLVAPVIAHNLANFGDSFF
jgi:membrane protease YdiL (CAAX protease family)